ncbi:MAG: 50S ribosomal protein L11 methyltransferase [Deltaproteobacteria bacterium]|nr:50S ribosomal protein L11 methyltransferase [Deltaproteobacteria bacterium]
MIASPSAASAPAFARIRARAAGARAELAAAEAWEAGAAGIEERDDGTLLVWAPAARAGAVRAALVAALGAGAVGGVEPEPAADWPETWKQGLRPLVVSERLVVRPPFAPHPLAPGQREVVIEPRQAFGTGAHATTALALEALDEALAERRGARVLDVGCGSGVLALAALALGAARAVACDLDPIAARETRENAARNALAPLAAFAGSLDALAPARFELVAANLIRRELEPLLAGLVARTAAGGALVLSGLLAGERAPIEASLAARGARVGAARVREDAGGDAWLALTATR